ncbi:MAG: hypothetical protein EH225_04320 [Calditrichaeota bacterium]|nr:hypothetical protein [Calditrichota bacterium]RQW05810.1 MAG: hypothetical protein EH225_04320 [Calditrichota bacterium]
MRKCILILIFVFAPINSLFSNPIVLPQAFISEFKFDGNNNWYLEIDFEYSMPFQKQDFDSICISSRDGFSRIRLDNIQDNTDIFVVTSDSLMTSLSINRDGDDIKLHSFLSDLPYDVGVDSLCFGNLSGSVIDSIQTGYSVTRIGYYLFSKDKSPTIGLPNDTCGTCGTLYGRIYDKNNISVTTGNFKLDNPVFFRNDGTYFTRVFSRKAICRFIIYNYMPGGSRTVRIDSLRLNINPDSLYESDIHFQTDYLVGLKDSYQQPISDLEVLNYPNPFNSRTNFKVQIPPNLQNEKMNIDIFNVIGQKIVSIKVMNNSLLYWDGKDYYGNQVSSGRYHYQLRSGNKVYKNGSVILLK